MLRQAQHDEIERHPEPVSVFANRSRRVCSSTEQGMLRQAQHDEVERHPEQASVFCEPQSKGTVLFLFQNTLMINSILYRLGNKTDPGVD